MITVPTLAIIGTEDQAPLHEITNLVATEMANVQKVIIPDAGHHPNLEQRELFNQVVQEFLDKIATH